MPGLETLSAKIKAWARDVGFDRVHICPAVEPQGFHRFLEWLSRGYSGEMQYLQNRKHAYQHPRHVLEGARSLVMLAMNYAGAVPPITNPTAGRVSRYAWGEQDYHDLIHSRLDELRRRIKLESPQSHARGVVDTAPLLEREFAELAGIGWIGKHTLLLNRQMGSYFFLAALLLDQELAYDPAGHKNYCGSCTACLDACPTQAFVEPYVLDATRCISYLTIEHQSPIAVDLRTRMGDWIFGCDVCQDVCPWNRDYATTNETDFQPRTDLYPVDLVTLFTLDEATFRQRFRRTPIWRAKRRGLLRNAAIALGNRPSDGGLEALCIGITDEEPLVREASAWALGRYAAWPRASEALSQCLAVETDPAVAQSVRTSLECVLARPR